jgi:hypothetical protein
LPSAVQGFAMIVDALSKNDGSALVDVARRRK